MFTIKNKLSSLCLSLLCCLTLTSYSFALQNKPVRLATTTSTENSGLLDYLLPEFKKDSNLDVHVIAVGTGKALRMGRDGDVDVLLVHAPTAEQEFIAQGFGIKRVPVMYNDFVIIGSPDDPAAVRSSTSTEQVFNKIQASKSLFISRGDDSGTHKKEMKIWSSAKLSPTGSWYREIGQGMGKAIQIANELNAYTLTDRGTWLSYTDKVRLEILYQNDTKLHNPYSIIAVSNVHYPDININAAITLINWLTSKRGQQLIGQYKKYKQLLFTPSAE